MHGKIFVQYTRRHKDSPPNASQRFKISLLGGGWPPSGCGAVTFHRCEVGPNIKHQSCCVIYGEQKCPLGARLILLQARVIHTSGPLALVRNGGRNPLWERAKCRLSWICESGAPARSWVLVLMLFSCHYDIFRNGSLTFVFSSWVTGDLGTLELNTCRPKWPKMVCFTFNMAILALMLNFRFPNLRYPIRIMVTHYEIYHNGTKTTPKPNPNSLPVPHSRRSKKAGT